MRRIPPVMSLAMLVAAQMGAEPHVEEMARIAAAKEPRPARELAPADLARLEAARAKRARRAAKRRTA